MKNSGLIKKAVYTIIVVGLIIGIGAFCMYFFDNTYFGANALTSVGKPELDSQVYIDEKYIESVQKAGASVLDRLAEIDESSNHLISPLGISIPYSILLNGADGETYRELSDFLLFDEFSLDEINTYNKAVLDRLVFGDMKNIRLGISNALWVDKQYDFESEFLEVCGNIFYSDIYQQDFQNSTGVKDNINKWVRNNSYGKIDSIIDDVSPEDLVYLISSVYFEGKWLNPFEKSKTAPREFFKSDGTSVFCDFMTGDNLVKYKSSEIFQAVSVPYEDEFSMILAMPNEDEDISLSDLLDSECIKEILLYENWEYSQITDEYGNLSHEPERAKVIMPKFSFSCENDMIPILQSLGVNEAFDRENADFSNADRSNGLYINKMKQKTFIEVNEEKTIAISFNLSGFGAKSSDYEPVVVVFDRPFIFAIVNTFGIPIFMGVMNNPDFH